MLHKKLTGKTGQYTPLWDYAPLGLTILLCIGFGCIGSEYIQSMLPVCMCRSDHEYKTFQSGDVVANLLGGSIGLYISYKLERKYQDGDGTQQYVPLDLENPSESRNEVSTDL